MRFSKSTAIVTAIPVAIVFFLVGQNFKPCHNPTPDDGNPVGFRVHANALTNGNGNGSSSTITCSSAKPCTLFVDMNTSPNLNVTPITATCPHGAVFCFAFPAQQMSDISSHDYLGSPHPTQTPTLSPYASGIIYLTH